MKDSKKKTDAQCTWPLRFEICATKSDHHHSCARSRTKTTTAVHKQKTTSDATSWPLQTGPTPHLPPCNITRHKQDRNSPKRTQTGSHCNAPWERVTKTLTANHVQHCRKKKSSKKVYWSETQFAHGYRLGFSRTIRFALCKRTRGSSVQT